MWGLWYAFMSGKLLETGGQAAGHQKQPASNHIDHQTTAMNSFFGSKIQVLPDLSHWH
jgi:hypothetical protein